MKVLYIIGLWGLLVLQAHLTDAQDSLYRSTVQEVMSVQKQSSWLDIQITSASKSEEDASKAPAMIRVVTEEQIKARCYRSLYDLITDLPDVKTDGLANEQSFHQVSFRGHIGNNFFIILLDGVKISAPTNEAIQIMENYPLHAVKQVEIVYGAGSALYGADAVSGVINIITKNPEKKFALEASPVLGNNSTYSGQIYIGKRIDRDMVLNVFASYHYEKLPNLPTIYGLDMSGYKTGKFKTTFGEMTPTEPYVPRFEAEIESYAVSANLKSKGFEFMIFRNYARNPTAFPANTQNNIVNKEVFFGNSVTVGSISYEKQSDRFKFTSQVTGSIHEIDPRSNYRNTFVGLTSGYKYGYGSMIKADQQLQYKAGRKANITAGITYELFEAIPKTADLSAPINRREPLSSLYVGTNIPVQFFNIKYGNVGGYLQYKHNFEKVFLTLGTRYDRNSRFGGTFNPRLGIVYLPTEKTSVRFIYASAFFAPNPETAFSHYGSFYYDHDAGTYKSYFWRLPNPDLKPILSNNLELGFRHTLNENLVFSANAYFNRLRDLFGVALDSESIKRYNGKFLGYDVDAIEVGINQGKKFIYGLCLQADFQKIFAKGKINGYSSLSLADSRESGAQGTLLTPLIFKAGFDLTYGKISFSPRIIATGRQRLNMLLPDNPTVRESIDGFWVVNFALRYMILKNSYVYLSVMNAANSKYYGAAYGVSPQSNYFLPNGIPQLPLRAQIGLQANF